MKFCGYCGASLEDSALSFCPECGKQLVPAQKQGPPSSERKNTSQKRKLKKKKSEDASVPEIVAVDDGYDGYYDDVPTDDDGGGAEGIDPKLLKQVLLIALGALIVIGLSTLVIFLL